MIVLDTNVLSELMRPEPATAVIEWVDAQPSESLFTTTVSQAEILFGLELLPDSERRRRLSAAVDAMFAEDFSARVLPFDSAAAKLFAIIAASRRRTGRPVAQFDAQIAAIARSRGAALATRNVADFAECDLHVVNPWSAGA